MRLSTPTESAALNVDGRTVPVLLYAGGTTGLVLLARAGRARAFCAWLGERAESDGLSALAFAEDTTVEPATAAEEASRLLGRLGVEQTVVVAAGPDCAGALRAAGKGVFEAVVLIDPVVELDALEPLLAEVRVAKLVLVLGADEASQETAAVLYRYAIGPMAVRHLPGESLLEGETAMLVADTVFAFAAAACNGGRLT